VKRWCKRPPARRVTVVARQTPPGARPDSERSRVVRPSSRVGRWRLSATAAGDGWSPTGPSRGGTANRTRPMSQPIRTHLGLSANSSRSRPCRVGLARTAPCHSYPCADGTRLEGSGQRVRLVTPDMYPRPSPISPAKTNVTTGTGGSLLRCGPSEADQGWWDSDGLLAARPEPAHPHLLCADQAVLVARSTDAGGG
jgi:hypothetical protein